MAQALPIEFEIETSFNGLNHDLQQIKTMETITNRRETMNNKKMNAPSKSTFAISDLLLKSTISMPVFMTSILFYTGNLIINKSLAFLSGENRNHLCDERLSEIHSSERTKQVPVALTDLKITTGRRPYGPKIYIRK